MNPLHLKEKNEKNLLPFDQGGVFYVIAHVPCLRDPNLFCYLYINVAMFLGFSFFFSYPKR